MLRASTKPDKRRDFRRVPAESFELYISSGLERRMPDELHIEANRFPRKSLSAYWNGLPWVMPVS